MLEGRRRAKAAREAASVQTAMTSCTLIGGDYDHWPILAKQLGHRLPHRGTTINTADMKKWMKWCGFTVPWFKEWSGLKTVAEFLTLNPNWSMRAFAGVMLEEWESAQYWATHPRPKLEYKPVPGYKKG